MNRVEDQVIVTIADMELWTSRIFEAIDAGFATAVSIMRMILRTHELQPIFFQTDGRRIPLDSKEGIDVLGNMVENSSLSPNVNYYGRLHNEGHNMLAYIHDPDNSFFEGFGVIGDNTTAMRDPVFYRWHQHIDDVFQRHKRRFKPYSKDDVRKYVNLFKYSTKLITFITAFIFGY